MYVALSRVKALSDLSLVGDINRKSIRADKQTENEYERLRASQNLDDNSTNIISKSNAHNVVITLLNIRSFKKHYLDVRHDSKIVESDIMALTETRLKDLHSTNDIKNALSGFQIIFQNKSNDFLSLAICVNSDQAIVASGKRFFPEVNGFLVDLSKEKMKVNMLLLYRPKDMHPLLFCNNLENIVSSHEVKIVLGDFNINFYDETDSQHLKQMMNASNYSQIAEGATFVSFGCLLDHVYVKQSLLDTFKDIKCEVKSVYYSGHDSVQICWSKESGKILTQNKLSCKKKIVAHQPIQQS